MITIRTFGNGDLPGLLRVWLGHWSAQGPPPQVNGHRLEQAILTGRFFDPQTLLVAHVDGTITGWCHYLVDEFTAPAAPYGATIATLAVMPDADPTTGGVLIGEVTDRVRQLGCHALRAGLIRDDHHGYAGLEPLGFGIGVPMQDMTTTMLMSAAGFTPFREATSMMAMTDCYRPPVSRAALQLRRSASTTSQSAVPTDIGRASGLSHLDIQHYRLLDRSGQTLADTDFWFSDPEAEVLLPSMAILDLGPIAERGELSSEESYLIAAVCGSLAARSVSRVEAVIDSELRTLAQQLEKICFEPGQTGIQWQLEL